MTMPVTSKQPLWPFFVRSNPSREMRRQPCRNASIRRRRRNRSRSRSRSRSPRSRSRMTTATTARTGGLDRLTRRVLFPRRAPSKARHPLQRTHDRDGRNIFEHACRMGLEGILSKRINAPYRSGKVKTWLKTKTRSRPRGCACRKAGGSEPAFEVPLIRQRS